MEAEQPEKLWLAAYMKGDVAALSSLVEHYRRPLYAYIYNMLQGRGDAEEIFQEVWLRVIRNIGRYREKNFAGWLFRIAHNLFIDEIRKSARMAVPMHDNPDSPGESVIDRLASDGLSPDQEVHAHDLGARIRAAVAALPEDQREVFMMRTEADIPFKQIAEIQGITLNTALARMHYALQKLRPLLQEDYDQLTGSSDEHKTNHK